jgi:chromosome segregation ATPase
MDNEQITSRIEWLDGERRKDKAHIAELIKKIDRLETALEKSDKNIKGVGRDISALKVKIEKTNEFGSLLNSHKKEMKKEVDSLSKTMIRREREEKKLFDADIKRVTDSIDKTKTKLDEINKIKTDISSLESDDKQVNKQIIDLDQKIRVLADHDVENGQLIKLMEEDRRKDNLRVIDLTGEISSVRKKIDDYSTRIDLYVDNQKRVDTKIDEVVKVEREREKAQREFTENVDRQMVNRTREWKLWEKRFDDFETQISSIDPFIEKISLAERDVRKAQQAFDEITEKINRRINEITEMQRLGEERFRNEWATFRSSDHKRWTNYAMAQEEKQRESSRLIEKMEKSTSKLRDELEDIKEIQKHLLTQSEKSAQKLLDTVSEIAAESERFKKSLD